MIGLTCAIIYDQRMVDANDIMQVLRAATRTEHMAAEAAVNLPAQLTTIGQYHALLKRFYGFYSAIEKIQPPVSAAKAIMGERHKANWLQQDLMALGDDPNAINALPLCSYLPKLTTLPKYLGCLYVIEGSMLGGQIIARELKANWQLHADNGARFFNGYGSDTGQQWRAFGTVMRQRLSLTDFPDTIQTAKETFNSFQDWLTGTAA